MFQIFSVEPEWEIPVLWPVVTSVTLLVAGSRVLFGFMGHAFAAHSQNALRRRKGSQDSPRLLVSRTNRG
jgi:hypothetical protein